jgi:hypothetical protein
VFGSPPRSHLLLLGIGELLQHRAEHNGVAVQTILENIAITYSVEP